MLKVYWRRLYGISTCNVTFRANGLLLFELRALYNVLVIIIIIYNKLSIIIRWCSCSSNGFLLQASIRRLFFTTNSPLAWNRYLQFYFFLDHEALLFDGLEPVSKVLNELFFGARANPTLEEGTL